MPIREARLLLLGRLGLAFWLFWMVFSRVDTMGERGVYIDHGMSGLPYLFRTALVAKVYFSSESIKSPSMSNRHARTGGNWIDFLDKFSLWKTRICLLFLRCRHICYVWMNLKHPQSFWVSVRCGGGVKSTGSPSLALRYKSEAIPPPWQELTGSFSTPSIRSFTMSTRTERFQRKGRDKNDKKVEEPEEIIRFSAEEEAVCLLAYNRGRLLTGVIRIGSRRRIQRCKKRSQRSLCKGFVPGCHSYV